MIRSDKWLAMYRSLVALAKWGAPKGDWFMAERESPVPTRERILRALSRGRKRWSEVGGSEANSEEFRRF